MAQRVLVQFQWECCSIFQAAVAVVGELIEVADSPPRNSRVEIEQSGYVAEAPSKANIWIEAQGEMMF
jgi:hypothetical protein